MFKLVVLFAMLAVASARPGYLTAIVGEKTIESHGNAIVHSSVPVVQTYAAPAPVVYASQPLLAEKTVSGYGHSVVHHQQIPVLSHAAYVAAPAYYL